MFRCVCVIYFYFTRTRQMKLNRLLPRLALSTDYSTPLQALDCWLKTVDIAAALGLAFTGASRAFVTEMVFCTAIPATPIVIAVALLVAHAVAFLRWRMAFPIFPISLTPRTFTPIEAICTTINFSITSPTLLFFRAEAFYVGHLQRLIIGIFCIFSQPLEKCCIFAADVSCELQSTLTDFALVVGVDITLDEVLGDVGLPTRDCHEKRRRTLISIF